MALFNILQERLINWCFRFGWQKLKVCLGKLMHIDSNQKFPCKTTKSPSFQIMFLKSGDFPRYCNIPMNQEIGHVSCNYQQEIVWVEFLVQVTKEMCNSLYSALTILLSYSKTTKNCSIDRPLSTLIYQPTSFSFVKCTAMDKSYLTSYLVILL